MEQVHIGKARVNFDSLIIEGEAGRYSVEPKVLEVLHTLMENQGEVISRDDLIDAVWGVEFGGDERLSRAISLLRKAFGDRRGRHKHIETISKRGYRLIAPVNGKSRKAPNSEAFLPPPLSIAVLPFIDMNLDRKQHYLPDGMSEDILNALTHIPDLSVTGRNSAFSQNLKDKSLRDISATLNVQYLLEGSVRQNGNRVRVTAQLMKAPDGYRLWSDSYDGELNDIFKLQDQIARSIASELACILGIATTKLPAAKTTRNTEAYMFFLQGRELVHQLNGQTTIPTGIEHLKQAITIDPDFADAHAWLALAHFILPEFSRTPHWQKHFDLSREALDCALSIAPHSSMALLVKAMRTAHDGHIDQALAVYEQAVKLDPNNIETMAGFGLGLMAAGLHEKARPYWERIIAQDPLCGIWHTTYGGLLLAAGEFEKAEAAFHRSFELGFGSAAFGVSHRMAERGAVQDAIAFMEANFDGLAPFERAELRSPIVRRLLYGAYLKKTPLAKRIVRAGLKRRFKNRSVQPTAATAIGFLFLNDPASFIRNILEKPNPYVGYTIARIWEPTAESQNVRTHKDFRSFAERLGLPRVWAKYHWPKNVVPWNTAS